MKVAYTYVDRLTWFDVGDFLLENIRPVLDEQTRTVPLAARFVVNRLCLLFLAQDAADAAFADDHQEFIDRGFFRQREQVNRPFCLRRCQYLDLLRATGCFE